MNGKLFRNIAIMGYILICFLSAEANGTITIDEVVEAIRQGNRKIVKKFIDQGGDVNARFGDEGRLDFTLLHGAIFYERLGIVRLLLENGADPNEGSGFGFHRPLHVAAFNGSYKIAQLLLEHGADPNEDTPLSAVTYSCSGKEKKVRLAIMKLLIKNGADVNQESWRPALSAAIGCPEAVDLILDAGANIDIRSSHGKTPLYDAIMHSNFYAVEKLIRRGANVNVINDSYVPQTPLDFALSHRRSTAKVRGPSAGNEEKEWKALRSMMLLGYDAIITLLRLSGAMIAEELHSKDIAIESDGGPENEVKPSCEVESENDAEAKTEESVN